MSAAFGWLFDVYPAGDGMAVWLIEADGQLRRLQDRFTPAFYVNGASDQLRRVWRWLSRSGAPVQLRRAQRRDLFLDREIDLLEVGVEVPRLLPRLFRQVHEAFPDLSYYDADISLEQRYFLARGAFPLAYCTIEHDGQAIHSLQSLDSPYEIDYRLPPLRVMTLRLSGEMRNPSRGHRGDLLIEMEGRTYRFPRDKGREAVLGVRYLLERYDPDVLISTYGDNYILPRLIELARRYRISLPLNRDPERQVLRKAASSYFSYGRVVFRDEQHLLFGRWHLDCQNAFLANDYGMDGILEIARLTGLPPQITARVSTGTGISAMQVATALRRGVLVPWQKRQPETLKTGLDLLAADKGGLVYTPIAGLHQYVAELDFSAMYPSIMVHFNISPETVGASCCDGVPIPELGTPVCRHRQGLVPETLEPLLEKRRHYKKLIRTLPADDPRLESYRRRYSAHKWLLVTCFGYLGYKNARFGRIEAHEAVNAYGREIIMQTKELVEARGFEVLHIYVDGLWIHKPGAKERPDYEQLIEDIHAQTGLYIGLEGIYRWLAFLPSRTEPRVAVANRYFGAYQDGSLKVRGIEARRRDTPAYIKETQMEMLAILAEGEGRAGFKALLPAAIDYAAERLRCLRAGQAPRRQLIVTHRLSRHPEEYTVRTAAARVAIQLHKAGVELLPGERMRFLYAPGPEKALAWEMIDDPENAPYDREAYTELMLRAIESVVAPVGVDRRTVDTWLLARAGYWGPPGQLPPPGADLKAPLLHGVGLRPETNAWYNRRPDFSYAAQFLAAAPAPVDFKHFETVK
ncbi:MAG: DNA polymerase domain-containing protein [Anaerolineales bacterium]|jgi:DNA polymerase-2